MNTHLEELNRLASLAEQKQGEMGARMAEVAKTGDLVKMQDLIEELRKSRRDGLDATEAARIAENFSQSLDKALAEAAVKSIPQTIGLQPQRSRTVDAGSRDGSGVEGEVPSGPSSAPQRASEAVSDRGDLSSNTPTSPAPVAGEAPTASSSTKAAPAKRRGQRRSS